LTLDQSSRFLSLRGQRIQIKGLEVHWHAAPNQLELLALRVGVDRGEGGDRRSLSRLESLRISLALASLADLGRRLKQLICVELT